MAKFDRERRKLLALLEYEDVVDCGSPTRSKLSFEPLKLLVASRCVRMRSMARVYSTVGLVAVRSGREEENERYPLLPSPDNPPELLVLA